MTATNHVLTGALIAAIVRNPVIALPAALLSHFVLDALPHFGMTSHTTKKFIKVLIVDIVLASSFLFYLILHRPDLWQLLVVCSILAASPDLMWFPRFVQELKTGKTSHMPFDPITRFHRDIQWFQRPIGLIVEMAWFSSGLILLSPFIR